MRFAHYEAKDLASVRLAWIQLSVPFLERPASFYPRPRMPSATETGSQCEIETLLSAQGAAPASYTSEKVRAATPVRESLKSNPKKPLCCNLPTTIKSGFKIFSTGSRKHAVHQPTPYPRSACCKQRAGFKRSLHQFGSLRSTRPSKLSFRILKDLAAVACTGCSRSLPGVCQLDTGGGPGIGEIQSGSPL